MREMIDAANLRLIAPYVQGAWSGRSQDADDGQDVAIVGPK